LDQCDEIYGLDDTRIKNIGDLKKSIKDYRKEKKYNLPLTIKKPGDKFYRNIPININPVEKQVYKSLNFKEGFSKIVNAMSPSIVSIFNYSEKEQNPPKVESGFIIDQTGLIVTNYHVIDGADKIIVKLHNTHEHEAELIGKDKNTDLALLQIVPISINDLLEWGDSDNSKVGNWVLVFGNPLGLGLTVTSGIISRKQQYVESNSYNHFIQTDATINPGNSGGPLINMEGKVIGVNTTIFNQTGEGNIGLAIPSNSAKKVISDITKYGETKRGWLGVRIQEVTEEFAKSVGLDGPRGALVSGVQQNSPSDKGRIKAGDIILEFDGQKIHEMKTLPRKVSETEIGKQVKVKIWRNKAEIVLSIIVDELPSK
jgi:serine protease Do